MRKRVFVMRHSGNGLFVLGAMALLAMPAQAVLGQTPGTPVEVVPPPSWLFNDLACAPAISTELFVGPRVVGSQDTIIKHMLGPGDTLIIGAGSNAGMQSG